MIQFRDALCGSDWSDIRTTIGVNNMYDKFNGLLNNQINIYFPEIKIKINEKSENKPWITRTILNSINKKNTMYKHYMKSKSPSLQSVLVAQLVERPPGYTCVFIFCSYYFGFTNKFK